MTQKKLFYRFQGQNKYVLGRRVDRPSNMTERPKGLSLAWRYTTQTSSTNSNRKDVCLAKLIHEGANFDCSDLRVHWNGINYRVLKNTPDNVENATSHFIFEDCGGHMIVTGDQNHYDMAQQAMYFGNSSGIDKKHALNFQINPSQAWTIHFKIKGTSSTGSGYVGQILHICTNPANSAPNLGMTKNNLVAFGMLNNGTIAFRDHYQGTDISGTKTEWRDYKITFYPSSYAQYVEISSFYNKKWNFTAYPVNFKIVHNGSITTGSTYFTRLESDQYLLLASGAAVTGTSATNASWFKGHMKFLSIAQGEVGYSPYRTANHKVLFHFD